MKRFFSVAFVLAVVAASWVIYSREQDVEPTRPEGIETALVARGSVEAIIATTGSLAAERTEQVSLGSAGKVVQILVQEGDLVRAEQVLARLDPTDLELALKQARAALQLGEAQLAKALRPATHEEIATARAALESARASLEDLKKGPSTREKELSRLAVDQAKNTLWGAQGNRDAVAGSRMATGGTKTQAEAQVANAELGVKIAEVRHGQMSEPPKESAIRAAEAQVAQAEGNLSRLLSLPIPEDIAVIEAQVHQARINVEIAEERFSSLDLTAPFSGRLISWDLHVGDRVIPAALAGTLVDESRYHIVLQVDETEIGQVEPGQRVRISLDAFPDNGLEGEVSRIDVLGNNMQGIVTYNVRVEMSPSDLLVRPLMTAAVDIATERKDNALLVPNRALRRDKEGKYVEILRDGLPSRVYVKTGIAGEERTEILSGLNEGEEVIVGRPRQSIFTGGPFGG